MWDFTNLIDSFYPMDTVYAILKMLGCLGMFLYGMSLMSGGLQKLA